jgi:hypothetical protein
MTSKTAAIAAARTRIRMERFGRSWIVSSPWDWRKPSGPYTSTQPADWYKARATMTRLRAEYALMLMGIDDAECGDTGTLPEIVDAALVRHRIRACLAA